jgi:TonB-linked SusC/RagA family outer membrane protein
MPARHTAQTAAITGKEEGDWAHGYDFNSCDYTGIDPISGLDRTENVSLFNTSNNNPLMRMEEEWETRDEYRLQSSIFVEVAILENFWFKTSNGFNVRYREQEEFYPEGSSKSGSTSESFYNSELYTSLLSENTFSYKKRFQKHDVNALLGFSAQTISEKLAGIYGIDFATDYISTLNAAGSILQYDDDEIATGTWEEQSSMASLFSRFMYAYDDKYLLSTSIRTDGSSKFGEENRWGWFPSVSIGWRVTEEDMIKDAITWLDDLKLRTSYGVTGTDNIDNYVNVDLLSTASYALGGEVVSGIANNSTTLGNNALQWEQTNEYNSGFDLYMFDSRVGLIFDAYYSITKSLLYERSVNSISGYTEAWSNEGKVRNKGIEFTLTSYNIKAKNFTWNTSFNFSHNENRLLDLGGPQQLISSGERDEMYVAKVGDPLIQFYAYETDGVWVSAEEVENNASSTTCAAGGLRPVDQNNDGTIDADDFVAVGSPYPDFTWGVSNHFTYKGADLSFMFQGSQGGEVWNGDGYYNETKRYNKAYAYGRWVNADNPGDGETPYESNGVNHFLTEYNVQDASYIALKDLSIGYKFDKDVLRSVGIGSLRIYASFQNLWYHTNSDYKGINVEARNTSSQYESPLISGYQRGAFPTQRTYSFGLELTF